MDLFTPNASLLEIIGWDDKSQSWWTVFPGDTKELALSSYFQAVPFQIANHYTNRLGYRVDPSDEGIKRIIHVIYEALENAMVHGSKKGNPFAHGLFIGQLGVCNGFFDGDGYFRREDIKHLFESKTPLTEFDEDVPSRRTGVKDEIYGGSDQIHVDTEQGVLYCVSLLNFKKKS